MGRLSFNDIDKSKFISQVYKVEGRYVCLSIEKTVYSLTSVILKVCLYLSKMKVIFAITILVYIAVVFTEPIIEPECPDEDGPNATLLKDPYHCDSYYVCVEGEPILMKCPPGLHFHDALKTCDYPRKAKCKPLPLPSS